MLKEKAESRIGSSHEKKLEEQVSKKKKDKKEISTQ